MQLRHDFLTEHWHCRSTDTCTLLDVVLQSRVELLSVLGLFLVTDTLSGR